MYTQYSSIFWNPEITVALNVKGSSDLVVNNEMQILSDSEKRTHYDRYLLSQRMRVHRCSEQVSVMYTYESHRTTMKEMEVVEWLKWYRFALNDILSEKRIVVWSGYFDLLPDCFEAEERSACETPEVLHLVSGRDLFGMISPAVKVPELSQSYNETLSCFPSRGSGLCQAIENISRQTNSGSDDIGIHRMQATEIDYHASDAYKDLELHVLGKVVALATRVPPKSYCNGIRNADSQDHIHVYLSSHEFTQSCCTNLL